MVGVGGGASSAKNGLRKGDAAINEPDDGSGGVI